jgi:hypothetical protein
MTSNVVSFDEFVSDQQIDAHQSGLVRVILEGQDDVVLFKEYWFAARTDVFSFIEAGKLVKGAGCTGVPKAVAFSIGEGIPAIGIVDRDTLFRSQNWNLLFAIDPVALNQDWTETGVYTASLWEVEAYLFDPDLLAEWVGVAHKPPPAPQARRDTALTQTIDACQFLIAAAHFFAAMHHDEKKTSPRMFWNQNHANLTATCTAAVGAAAPPAQAVAGQVEALIAAVIANQPALNADRLRYLLRYVDTKRLLFRLGHALNISEGTHWILAALMKGAGRRPVELDVVLDHAEASLAT